MPDYPDFQATKQRYDEVRALYDAAEAPDAKAAHRKSLTSAMNDLGLCYFVGSGVRRNPQHAVEQYWKPAAEAGNAKAQYNLATAHSNSQGGLQRDLHRIITLYSAAARQGHDGAQNWLAYYVKTLERDQQEVTALVIKEIRKNRSFNYNNNVLATIITDFQDQHYIDPDYLQTGERLQQFADTLKDIYPDYFKPMANQAAMQEQLRTSLTTHIPAALTFSSSQQIDDLRSAKDKRIDEVTYHTYLMPGSDPEFGSYETVEEHHIHNRFALKFNSKQSRNEIRDNPHNQQQFARLARENGVTIDGKASNFLQRSWSIRISYPERPSEHLKTLLNDIKSHEVIKAKTPAEERGR